MGQAVSVAVGRFVAVGEAIATENQELKDEMGQACFEARRAGERLSLDLHFYVTFSLNCLYPKGLFMVDPAFFLCNKPGDDFPLMVYQFGYAISSWLLLLRQTMTIL